MAGFFQQFAKGFSQEFFGNPFLRDYTHAAKTFQTNAYQYSPKFKFLYHVYFDLNSELISGLNQVFGEANNLGLLVKNIELPKFSFDTHPLNQYNRTRIVQTKIKYDPISITFNDDNGNLARQLWYSYYSYYYKDPTNVNPGAGPTAPNNASAVSKNINERNIYSPSLTQNNDFGYIGESGNQTNTATGATFGVTKAPFFKSINIYGFNQHNFVLYVLVNPIITNFSHDTYDYSAGGTGMENRMTLSYEMVNYYDGKIDGRAPENIVKQFGSQQYYDRRPSPLARPGAIGTVLGQGGLLDAAGGVIRDLNSNPPNLLGAIQTAGTAYNTFKNLNVKQVIQADITRGLNSQLSQSSIRQSQFSFPTAATTPTQPPATIINDSGG